MICKSLPTWHTRAKHARPDPQLRVCRRRGTPRRVPRIALWAVACLLPTLAEAETHGAMLQMPVAPACVSSPFGPRILPNHPIAGTFHDGIDLPAPVGTRVRAVASGTLIRVQRHGVGGLEMLVQHAGFVAVYSHLGEIAPPILEGDRTITAGEWLGTVGMTGLTFGPHLYFGIFVDDRPVDPAPLLRVGACAGASERDPRVAPTRVISTMPPGAHPLATHPLLVHRLEGHRVAGQFLMGRQP
jgi:murein DD-endopeptidase MepM/ murein hydrolase activator NlpD